LFTYSIAIALVAIALATIAIALLYAARHPRCQRHGPCRPCPLCQPVSSLLSPSPLPSLPSLSLPSPSIARSHCLLLPTAVVVWSPRQCSLTSHCPLSLLLLLVDCHDYPMLPKSRDPSAGGQGRHIGEPVESALSLAGQCIHGEPTGEPTRGDLMVGKAGTRMPYHSSGSTLIANRRPSLRRLATVGYCVLC
jgi:hypothetical protein